MLLKILQHLLNLKRFASDIIISLENPKHYRNKKIGLQCHLTTPKRLTIIHDNLIDFNEDRDLFKDLNDVTTSYDWFLYEYMDAEVKKKVDKTKRQLAGDEMEN